MKHVKSFQLIALFVICSAVFAISISAQVQQSGQRQSYDSLLSKLKGGDLTIDFRSLRFAFADQTATEARAADPREHIAMLKLLNEKNFKEAVKMAEAIHKSNFVDMNSHIVAAMAHEGLRDPKKSKYHEAVYLGLVNSILNDGDGNSTKTAYKVISVAEEYVLLNALELKRGTKEVENADGSVFHVLTAIDKASNEPVKLYFNIDKVGLVLEKVPKN